jgi:Fe-S oxidoreductase
MKKIISVIMAAILSMSLLTACGGGKVEGTVDVEGKTTIQVAGYDAGLGLEWLKDAAKAFEAKYATESFEDGKEGVAVVVSGCEGADMMITACPLCMYNLVHNAGDDKMPVKYFTELLYQALGLEA